MALIDTDLKDYLEIKFKALTDKMDAIIASIQRDIEHHRTDLDDLYDKDREAKERIKEVEMNLKNHLDNHEKTEGNKKFSAEMIVVIIVFVITSVISFILK